MVRAPQSLPEVTWPVTDTHCRQIPKPNATEGLGIGWPQQTVDMAKMKELAEDIKSRI